ncbi:MAG: NUDIX hydrolase, partial [Myxococcota bacterium]
EEETGYRAGTIEPLRGFAGSSGISNKEFHLFLATDLREDGKISRENTEEIEVVLIPLAELREVAFRGELYDGPSALGILLSSRRLGL